MVSKRRKFRLGKKYKLLDITLSKLRTYGNNKVHSYWTHDGSIIVKKSEHSGTKVVRNLEDVDSLALGSLN